MDAMTITAALSALAGSATTIATVWLRTRSQETRARENSRRSQMRELPPGSRIVDLGRRGMVIDVGGTPGRPGND